ncbi:MAG: hypothetical protein AAF934_07980, partial [Bacteroidota bacterium]
FPSSFQSSGRACLASQTGFPLILHPRPNSYRERGAGYPLQSLTQLCFGTMGFIPKNSHNCHFNNNPSK